MAQSGRTIIQKLAENQRSKYSSLIKENRQLVNKWKETGLLDGIRDDHKRQNLARLLENQARVLIREATTMSDGDVEGFAQMVFPLVRRVFAETIADQLVTTQAMPLPTGLIFFLDYVYNTDRLGATADESVFGQGVVGKGIVNGVDLTGDNAYKGFYAGNNTYSKPQTTTNVAYNAVMGDGVIQCVAWNDGTTAHKEVSTSDNEMYDDNCGIDVNYDEDIMVPIVGTPYYYRRYRLQLSTTLFNILDKKNLIGYFLKAGAVAGTSMFGATARVVRNVTQIDTTNRRITFVVRATNSDHLYNPADGGGDAAHVNAILDFPIIDTFTAGGSLGTVMGDDWPFEGPATRSDTFGYQDYPEINFKLDSVDIRTISRYLKATWSMEVAEDFEAYQNLDAEVELSGMMSEQMKREQDNEILMDLLHGATAFKYYWDARPGFFVDMTTGEAMTTPPDFFGTPDKWDQTLIRTMGFGSAQIARKTLLGGATFAVCGPELANIFDSTNGFQASPGGVDSYSDSVGVQKAGSISKKYDLYVVPTFPRNIILMGRKPKQKLDTGYIWAPYVPAEMLATIPDPVSWTPRKALRTRYGKRMVKPDLFGLVIVRNMMFAPG